MRINQQEIEQAYRALRLEEFETYFENIQQRIDEVVNEESYQGKAACNMKAYLKEVHQMAVKSFLIVIMEIETGMTRFLNRLNQVDESNLAILDRDYLIHLQETVSRHRRDMQEIHSDFNQQANIANQIMNGNPFTRNLDNAMGELDHHLGQTMQVTENVRLQMEDFNNQQMREIETLQNHLSTLTKVLDKIDGVLADGVDKFKPGSFANSPLGRLLFEHMLASVGTMARNGSMNEATNALAIIGGFISTLPPQIRKLFKMMKGRAIWCAFVGDPVNAATGNFIYDHVDMKIDGRYPLELKRFYNSIDATTTTLGRNWTHTFDITIHELENGGATINYGDSRQEYYEKSEASGGNLIPTAGCSKVLKKIEKASTPTIYELTFTDGQKYDFNKTGQLIRQTDAAGNEIILTYEDDQLTRVESPSGYLEFSYDDNYITKITDHAGRSTSYEYENDLLSSYTNPLGHSYSYEYDLRKRLINIINQEGHLTVSNVYDEKDRIIKQTYADNTEMSYSYSELKRETTFTKQNGTKSIYKRDNQYRTTGIIEPDGEVKIEYNKNSQRSKYIDKLGGETSFEYDQVGNLSKVTNALGVPTVLTYLEGTGKLASITIAGNKKLQNSYDETGNLVSVEDALSNKTSISYEATNLPNTITQADGSKIQLTYDEKGNVTQVKDASDVVTNYRYDNLNRVVQTVDGNENVTSFTYDEVGNILEVKNAEGHTQCYEYNKQNKVTKITDFNDVTIKRSYNVLGKLSKVIDPLTRETTLEYDKLWNVSKITQPNGATTKFTYTPLNHLRRIDKPDGSRIGYDYDGNGNRIRILDEQGNMMRLYYDLANQLISVSGEEGLRYVYSYNAEGQVTSVRDGMGNIAHVQYNELGQIARERNALGDERTYTYTSLGKVESITDEAGRITTHEYEIGGRLKSITHPDLTSEHFGYDDNGNVKTHTNKLGQETEYTYDSLNRVIAITANGGTKTYTYDPVDNVTSMTDELGNTTNYEYSLTGKLTKVTDPLGNTTQYTYDLLDNLIEVCQEGSEVLGHDGVLKDIQKLNEENQGLRITKYHRNIMGQVESVEDALGNKETYSYSLKGELVSKLDKDGYLTKYGYTKNGDVNQIQYADGKEVRMSYNSLRQLTEIQDWLGMTRIEVDPLGRATKVTDHNDQVVEYSYGKLGQRESITYPDGKQVNYRYDDLLRLSQVDDGIWEINYQYDDFSRLTSKQFGDSAKTEYSYNPLGQLEMLNHFGKDGLVDSYQYQYDLLGNKTQIAKQRQGMEADSGLFNYAYDPLNRLTSVVKDGSKLRSYGYDNFGNRTKKVGNGNQTRYTYNSLNQLISSTDGMSYDYDKRGNQIEIFKNNNLVNKYHFGALNRLESTFNFEKQMGATYRYNGSGHRVGQTQGTSIEPVLLDTNLNELSLNPTKQIGDVLDITRQFHNLLERKEGGNRTSFTFDFGILSSSNDQGSQHYLLDELGSPVRLMDGIGAELDVFGYDEFGVPVHNRQNTNNLFAFTGYQVDPVANTHFAQAREYKPEVGRFMSEDIIKGNGFYPFTMNHYAYCWNRPLDLVDLDGLMPSSEDAAAMADYVYGRNAGDMTVGVSNINGWELVYIHTNTNNWFTQHLTFNGLYMGVFRYTHDDGRIEYALVNQGSNTWYNWVDNIRQVVNLGRSWDTRDSVRFARQFMNDRPGIEVTMIGHSKGGHEARINALATGSNAILFNPAATTRSSLRQNGMSKGMSVRIYEVTIITYIVEGEMLNLVQGRHTEHIGILRWLQPPGESMGAFERHGMDAVIQALRLRYYFSESDGSCK